MDGTTLITEEYRDLNAALHETADDYGVSSSRWPEHVRNLVDEYGIFSILDYGCGKGKLAKALPDLWVLQYDPAVEEFDDEPDPVDLVVCTDVLEHVEPEFVDNVLDDLDRLAEVAVFVTIPCIPAKKILSDGRNAHLTQEDYRWWLPKLWERWHLEHVQRKHGVGDRQKTIEFAFVGLKRQK